MENAACLGLFWVGTVAKCLVQRHLGYRETAPNHLKEKKGKKD